MSDRDHGDQLAQFITSQTSAAFMERVAMNVKQVLVVVTEDKIRICLTERITAYMKEQERAAEWQRIKQSWIAPFGILLAVITTFTTASFVDAFRMSKETWGAVFIMTAFFAAGWLVFSLYKIIATAIKMPSPTSPSETVSQIVADLQLATKSTVGATIQSGAPLGAVPIPSAPIVHNASV